MRQRPQQLAARDHHFLYRPADPERFYDLLILLAGDAAQERQWQTAFNIASQIDDVLPAGTALPTSLSASATIIRRSPGLPAPPRSTA